MELATGNDFNTWMKKPHTEPELYNALFQLMAGLCTSNTWPSN